MPKMPDIDKQNMMKSIAIVSYGEKDTNSLLVFFFNFHLSLFFFHHLFIY